MPCPAAELVVIIATWADLQDRAATTDGVPMFPVRRIAFATVSSRAAAACILAALAACGGGGGGSSGGGSLTPATFTSWGALPTNRPVIANGMSITRQSNGTIDPVDTSNSSAGVLYASRSSTGLRALTFTTPSGSTSWQASQGEINPSTCSGRLCSPSDGAQKIAVFSDPYSVNAWNYQSFGVWSTGPINASTISAISFGAPTAGSAIPTSGTATYTGSVIGRYVAAATDFIGVAAGTQFGMGASLQADVNFGARQINMSISGTALLKQGDAPPPFADPRFDSLTPTTLSYAAGSNAFSGTVVSSSNPIGLSGTVNGRFYGPAGQELGGTMSLSTAGGGALIGAFGAKCTAGSCP